MQITTHIALLNVIASKRQADSSQTALQSKVTLFTEKEISSLTKKMIQDRETFSRNVEVYTNHGGSLEKLEQHLFF